MSTELVSRNSPKILASLGNEQSNSHNLKCCVKTNEYDAWNDVVHECVIYNGYNMDDEIISTDLAIEITENIYGIKIFIGSAI